MNNCTNNRFDLTERKSASDRKARPVVAKAEFVHFKLCRPGFLCLVRTIPDTALDT